MRMRNALRRFELLTLPSWLCVPLIVLGGMYLIALPLGVAHERAFYIWALFVAGASGVFFSWRYHVSVVERSEDWVLMRCGLRKSSSVRNPQERD